MAVTVDWPVTADSRPATPAPGCLTDNNQRTVDIPPVPGGQSVLHRALLWLTVSMLQLPGGQIRVVQDPGGVGTISRSLGRAWGFATKAIKGTHDSTLTQPCSHHSASAVGACKNHKRSRIKTNCPPPLWVALGECLPNAPGATFLLTIPTSAPDLPSHGEAPKVDHVALHTFPTKHVAQ